jgi:hypothetical protein
VERGDLDLGTVVATLRAFLDRAEALRVVVLLDRGEAEEPLLVDLDATGALDVGAGETVETLDLAEFAAGAPLPIEEARPLAPIEVDAEAGQLTAPLGAIERTAAGVRAAARVFGGRSVFTAAFATIDPGTPLFMAARGEEPLVISLGDREWELPEG